MRRELIFLPLAAALGGQLPAHELRPAYLEIRQTGAESFDLLWKVPARGDGLRLGLYVRLPEGCKETSPRRSFFAGGAHLERWSAARRGGLDGESIHIDGLAATLTDALIRLERLDGTVQVARLTASQPSFVVETVPGMMQVAGTYLSLGVEHILSGIDHLLFVLALLFLVRGWRRVVGTVTAFTVAHSLTLAAATLGFVHAPGPPVEASIALSIVFVAAEIVHARRGLPGLTARSPWIVAFTFGLLHGFGFAGALSEVGLPQGAIPAALFFFNLGVELGQLLFVGAVVGVFAVFKVAAARVGRAFSAPRPAARLEIAAAYAIGAVASFWVVERTCAFWS